MSGYYDRDGQPITFMQWARLTGDPDAKRVGLTVVGPYIVSTVWLGIDHSYSASGPPVLFETMVFPSDGWDEGRLGRALDYQERYCTLAQARQGHEETVTLVRATLSDEWPDAEPVEREDRES